METPKAYDEEWRKASVTVYADLKGVLGFRQFRLTNNVQYYGPMMRGPRNQHFEDDFTLASIFAHTTWRPRKNVAECNVRPNDHPAPSFSCTCGFYASYSSTIVYHPDLLLDKLYCFGAVRGYGNIALAENGFRCAGANVAGLLFHPQSKGIDTVRTFMKRLDKEGIFYTFKAADFIEQFPDESYTELLEMDPIVRLGNLVIPNQVDMKTASYKFCRPLREEILVRDSNTCVISLHPDHRPWGRLYKHPLLEVWPK